MVIMIAYALNEADLLGQCTQRAATSSGPGGQHANKTRSAVTIVHQPSGCTVSCQDHRDRRRNAHDALKRLRIRLACELRGGSDPQWLDPYRRGRGLSVSVTGAGYHLVVGVLLDALDQAQGRPAAAAAALGVSTTQLVRCLAEDKEVFHAAQALAAQHQAPMLRR